MIDQQIKPPKPLSCSIEGSVKRTTFNLVEIREFVANTTDEYIEVTIENGKKSFVLVKWLRRALQESKANLQE